MQDQSVCDIPPIEKHGSASQGKTEKLEHKLFRMSGMQWGYVQVQAKPGPDEELLLRSGFERPFSTLTYS